MREDQRNALLASPDFQKADVTGRANMLYGIGDVEGAGKITTSAAAASKDDRESKKAELEMAISRRKAFGGVLAQAAQNPASAMQLFQGAIADGLVAPEYVQGKLLPAMQQAPNVSEFFRQGAQASLDAATQFEQQYKQMDFGLKVQGQGETQRHNRATEGLTDQGQRLTDARSREANTAARASSNVGAEMKLSDDYRAQAKPFKEVADAYRTITSTLDQATTSPAATLAAATKFMKLLDPGSVVRESELGMALAASGVIDRATNYINVLQSGKVLTPTQVKDFKNITEQIYQASQQGQQRLDADYTQKAQGWGLNPASIVQNLGQSDPAKGRQPNGSGGAARPKSKADFDALPSGATFIAPDGSVRRKP